MNTSPHRYAAHPRTAARADSPDRRGDSDCVTRLEEASRIVRLENRVFGFTPMDSLVFVGVRDGRTGEHMRIDRGPALRDPVGVAQWAAQRMTESGDGASAPADAVLVFIYEPTSDAAAATDRLRSGTQTQEETGAVMDHLVSTLRQVFEQEYCLPIGSIYSVSPTHVRDYGCTEPLCASVCASPGVRWRSGDLGPASAIGAPAGDDSGAAPAPRETPQRTCELTSSAAYGRRVMADFLSFDGMNVSGAAHEGHSARNESVSTVHHSMRGALERWEAVLCVPEADTLTSLHTRPALLRDLSRSLESRSIRDALIPLAAESLDLAVQVLPAEASGTQGPKEHRAMSWLVYRDIVLGESGHAPRWHRIDRLARTLQICHSTAEEAARENIYGLMAWIEWARGRGSAAGGFIDYCLDRHPDNVLCRLIDELMRRGQICPWARVEEHSWTGESEAVPHEL